METRVNDSATLIVRRTADHDLKERELYVSVDGGPNTILRFGDTARLSIPPGRHRLRVHNTWKRQFAEFDVEPGGEVRFAAANVAGSGYQWMAVFLGFALMNTELHREDHPTA
jgi:hypothetical protein